jgi:hypothetical protein
MDDVKWAMIESPEARAIFDFHLFLIFFGGVSWLVLKSVGAGSIPAAPIYYFTPLTNPKNKSITLMRKPINDRHNNHAAPNTTDSSIKLSYGIFSPRCNRTICDNVNERFRFRISLMRPFVPINGSKSLRFNCKRSMLNRIALIGSDGGIG